MVDTILSQMEQRSILNKVVNYIQYDRHPENCHNLDIKAVNQRNHKRRPNTKEENQMLVRFWRHTREIKRRIFRYI